VPSMCQRLVRRAGVRCCQALRESAPAPAIAVRRRVIACTFLPSSRWVGSRRQWRSGGDPGLAQISCSEWGTVNKEEAE